MDARNLCCSVCHFNPYHSSLYDHNDSTPLGDYLRTMMFHMLEYHTSWDSVDNPSLLKTEENKQRFFNKFDDWSHDEYFIAQAATHVPADPHDHDNLIFELCEDKKPNPQDSIPFYHFGDQSGNPIFSLSPSLAKNSKVVETFEKKSMLT